MRNFPHFTPAELLIGIAFFGLIGTAAYSQYENVRTVHRDQNRKIAINAMHHNLEEIVRPKLGGYPKTITAANMTAMDKKLLKDPSGSPVGSPASDYRYEPTGCNGGSVCADYTLRADLEHEADFIKRGR